MNEMGDGQNMKRSASTEALQEDDQQASKRRRGNGRAFDVRFLLQSKNAGAIIGKGGSNINRLRKDYKASVTVPDCPGPERILTIVADIETVGEILMDIIPKLEDYSHHRTMSFDCEMRMLLHQSHAGCVIGRGGQRIKELREKTGAQIKVYTSCCPDSTERVAQISGFPEVVVNCVKEICDLITQAPIKGPNQMYDPHNFSVFYAPEYGGYGEQGGRGGGRGGGGGGGRDRGGRGGGGRGRGGSRGGGGQGGQAPWREDRINEYEQFLPPEHGQVLNQRGARGGGGNIGGGGLGGGSMYGQSGGGMGPARGQGGYGNQGGSMLGNMGGGGNVQSFQQQAPIASMGGGQDRQQMWRGPAGGGGGLGANTGPIGNLGAGGGRAEDNYGMGGGGGRMDSQRPASNNRGGGGSLMGNPGMMRNGGFMAGNMSGAPDQIGMRGNVTDFSETGGMNEWMNKPPGGEFNQGGPAQVTIPNEMAGAIIGKGGQRIRTIRRESGAEITINDAKPGSAQRTITITGTPQQIQTAEFLLQQSMQEHSGGNRY